MTLAEFREKHCAGREYDSCANSPCRYSNPNGCQHPLYPTMQRLKHAGWSVTNILPPRLQRAGFTLTEDEDFLVLWHEGEWIARFLGIATNMPYIMRECDAHLETHPVVVSLGA